MAVEPLAAEPPLLATFVELADTLAEDYDRTEFLHRLAVHCARLFGGPAAGIMLVGPGGEVELAASSSRESAVVELFQLQTATGPCLDCIATEEPVRVPDLAAESDRWPEWSAVALTQGFRSVYATPMRLRDQTIGALNLFGTESGFLSEHDLNVVRTLTDIATIGILSERAIRCGGRWFDPQRVAIG